MKFSQSNFSMMTLGLLRTESVLSVWHGSAQAWSQSLKMIKNDFDPHRSAVDSARLLGTQRKSRFQRDT